MKRPGDEPSPTLQPASKLQKSVTFSFPIQSTQQQAKETISTPYPSSSSTSLPSASPVMQTGKVLTTASGSKTQPQGSCKCTSDVDWLGYGDCGKVHWLTGKADCYVETPSTCSDLSFKNTSYEACQGERSLHDI